MRMIIVEDTEKILKKTSNVQGEEENLTRMD